MHPVFGRGHHGAALAGAAEARHRHRAAGSLQFPSDDGAGEFELGAYIRSDDRVAADIDDLCRTFKVLGQRRKQLAGNLSGGEQQMLEMAMALMVKPRLILMDEPSLGLSPLMQAQVFADTQRLRDLGATVLMVEQNAVQALKVADRAIVVELGRASQEGSGLAMLDDPQVRRAYLGLTD